MVHLLSQFVYAVTILTVLICRLNKVTKMKRNILYYMLVDVSILKQPHYETKLKTWRIET